MDRKPETDIEKVWHQQPRDAAPISVDEIRARAERFDSRTRWWRTVGAAVVIIAVVAEVLQVWYGRDTVERTGDLLTIAAFFYIAYEYRKYSLSLPERLGLSGVDFYRAQLVHERNLAGQSSRYLLPFVPGVTLSLLHGVIGEGLTTVHRTGVVIVGVALFVGVAWVNARSNRRLQREIDAINSV
jgi:hypothetical protein